MSTNDKKEATRVPQVGDEVIYNRLNGENVTAKVLKVLRSDTANSTVVIKVGEGSAVVPYAPNQVGGWGWPQTAQDEQSEEGKKVDVVFTPDPKAELVSGEATKPGNKSNRSDSKKD